MTFVYATVTCKDAAEAQTIADGLLADKLIACAKITTEVSQSYWWKGVIEKGNKVMLIMETHESRLPKTEARIAQLHSYDTFVLTAVPMVYVSKDARLWLQEVLNLL
jgi:periplasmic divalent cation tolerance protein